MTTISAKVYFHRGNNEDIRRVQLPTAVPLADLFSNINTHHDWVSPTTVELKYVDEDNDLVQFSSQGEWEIALDQAKNMTTPFRLHVTYKTQNAEQQFTAPQQESAHNTTQENVQPPQQGAPNLNALFSQYAPYIQQFMNQRAQQNPNVQQPNINDLMSTYGPMVSSFLQNLGGAQQGSGGNQQPNIQDLMRQFGVDPTQMQNMMGQWQQPSAPSAPQQAEPSVDDLLFKYTLQLDQLANMGFYEREKNARLLEKYYGSIERVIQVLMDE